MKFALARREGNKRCLFRAGTGARASTAHCCTEGLGLGANRPCHPGIHDPPKIVRAISVLETSRSPPRRYSHHELPTKI